MATIKDVADKAGVSITTVSHVINQTRYVSEELTQKVTQAMADLNYQQNILASSLRSGRSKTIGLIIPDISNLFFAEISRKIEDKGFEYGYSVILCNTDDNISKEIKYIDVLQTKQVDGIIFISAGGSESILTNPLESDIPVVVADRDSVGFFSDVVLIENRKGGYDATNYLISLNHRKIACISGPSLITPSAQRVEGYKTALQDAGIPFEPSFLQMGDFRFESGNKAMREILKSPDLPTAVFVCNDMMAIGAMRAIKDFGLHIPDDISIVGFDNIPLSNIIFPALTTIAQPMQKMANLILELLVEKIKIKENRKRHKEIEPEYQRIVLYTELIVRDSCKKIEK